MKKELNKKSVKEEINFNRIAIDKIDQKILNLIHERLIYVRKIGALKGREGSKIYRPDREKNILDKLLRQNANYKESLNQKSILNIFKEVISVCRAEESYLSIGYLGPEGTFTHLAAKKQFGSAADYFFCKSIKEVFSFVENGQVDYGVVPIENSTEGSVSETLDLLIDTSLVIYGELYLTINHHIIGNVKNFDEIKKIYAHPQTFGQCREFIANHIPNAQQIPMSSNGEAVKKIKKIKNAVAISSQLSSEIHQVPIFQKKIEDLKNNYTRFVVLSKKGVTYSSRFDKTSFLLSIENKAGKLKRVLQDFEKQQINIVKLESRPSRKKAFDYFFFIDVEGHCEERRLIKAIEKLKSNTLLIKLLGSYPQNSIKF